MVATSEGAAAVRGAAVGRGGGGPLRARVRGALRAARRDGPLLTLVVVLVVGGVWLRATDLGFPPVLTWDEHHFVENARNYLAHRHDWNDHPPFGKLLMAVAIAALGDTSVGWRTTSLLFGVGNVVVAASLAARLFRDRRAGWLAAAFVAGDGFLIAYSRTALLDGILTTFVLAVVWLAAGARGPGRVALAAVAVGLAASIKTSGFVLGLPVAVLCLRHRRPWLSLATLALSPAVYLLLFSLGLHVAHEPATPVDAFQRTLELVRAAAGVNTFRHPLTSHWYTWFLPTRPITVRFDPSGPFAIRAATTLGNLVLWWSAAAAFAWSGVACVRGGVAAARARPGRARLGRTSRGAALLFGFALTLLLPWMSGVRDSYLYHYLPTYALLLTLLGGLVARHYRRRRGHALLFVAAVTLVSAFYAPVWAQLEVTPAAFEARLFFPRWR